MDAKPFKTAYELADMIVERASALHGPWPTGMTMFIFDDAYGWSASISQAVSEVENVYRIRTLNLIAMLRCRFDLASPRLSSAEDPFWLQPTSHSASIISIPKEVHVAKGQQRGNREAKKPKKEKIKVIAAAPNRKVAALQPIFASTTKK
jgi:hypothetical protein